jgi:Uma2 family endonuclease
MESSKRVWTYAELQRMPESHDGRRYEIIDGDLVVSPSPAKRHQRASGNTFYVLRREIENARLGIVFYAPFDVVMSRTRVVVPDLVAVRADRMHLVEDRGIFGAPDLIVEILSPSNKRYDRGRKRGLYANVGVPEYWIVDPIAQTIEQLILADNRYALDGFHRPGDRLHAAVFPVSFDVAEIFQP